MKVGIFISNQLPQTGGAFTFESQLLKGFIQFAHESKHEFVVYTSSSLVPDHLSDSPFPVVSTYRWLRERIESKLVRISKAIFQKLRHPKNKFEVEGWYNKHILKLLKTHQVDVTLSLTPGCPLEGFPNITTSWDLQHRLQPFFPEVSGSGILDRRDDACIKTFRYSAYIITGTEVGKQEIKDFYSIPTSRIKVIPFFTPQFALESKLANGAKENALEKYKLPQQYLFYPAQFWAHKNHVNLLLGLQILKEIFNLEFPIVFVGADKGNKSYIEEIVQELNLSEQVYFLGFVPQEDIIELYRNAFALVFMTFFGPDNLPPLEAMALGCPVIASRISGAEEQLGDAALLVSPTCPEQIANAIKLLWEDSSFRQVLIKKGYTRANQWTIKNYIEEVLLLIDDFEAIRKCWE